MTLAERPEWTLLVALGAGLVLGLERERAKGVRRRAAGLRTFALVSLAGGVAAQAGSEALLAVLGAGVVALAVVAAWRAPPARGGPTTEVALLLAFGLGALAQTRGALAFATSVVAAAVLAFRARLHGLARRLFTDAELQNALVLGVAALVVLPLLPQRPLGPLAAVNPFDVWKLVVLVMAVGALGSLAQRLARPRFGLALAGLASGFVSSAATVAAMARLASTRPDLLREAVAGATASSVSTLVQLAILVSASSPALLRALAVPLALGAVVTALVALVHARRAALDPEPGEQIDSAFRLQDAIVFAALVTAVVAVSAFAQRRFGGTGVLVAATLSGLADAHAFAASAGSLVSTGQLGVSTAATATLAAASANAVTKMVLAGSIGPRGYRGRVVLGQLVLLAGLWVGWVAARP